jgi:agmatinase
MGSEAGNPYSERGIRVWPAENVIDHGDVKVPARAGVRGPIDAISRRVAAVLEVTPRLLVLGGDHAVSYPVVRAVAGRYGRLDMLHFDAHPDLYPEYEGNRYSHASPMARILEDGCVERLVQVGIRSISPQQSEVVRRYGVETHAAYDVARMPRLCFGRPLYISIDIDGLDPAFAPGVSHPEPGGLTVRQVLDIVAETRGDVVGADVVELNPRCDLNGVTAIVAAKLAKEMLARLLKAA